MALIFVELVDINDGDLDEVDEDLMELAGDKEDEISRSGFDSVWA